MNINMIYKSIVIASVMILGASAANAQAGASGLSDTSKVCASQLLTLTGPAAPSGQTYTYAWTDATGTPITGAGQSVSVAATVTANTTGTPIVKTYKLTVTQTGGAACPSTEYTKVLVIYPQLAVAVAAANPFYCVGSAVDLVITATTTAGGGNTPGISAGGYGGLVYTWTPGTTPAAPAGIANTAGNVYTVAAANFPAVGTYTYNAAVTYAQALVGTPATMALCNVSNSATINITAAPAVNSTTVTTTYQ